MHTTCIDACTLHASHTRDRHRVKSESTVLVSNYWYDDLTIPLSVRSNAVRHASVARCVVLEVCTPSRSRRPRLRRSTTANGSAPPCSRCSTLALAEPLSLDRVALASSPLEVRAEKKIETRNRIQ